MCGIVGIVSKNEFSSKEALSLLKRLEYRGYDSFGVADNSGNIEKFVGEIDENKIKGTETGNAIYHTRWSTHGGVTQANAHPHADCKNEIFIVHNGIIDNYIEMKKVLEHRGHVFKSQTDSEVIAHFFEEELKTKTMSNAAENFFVAAKGEFAVLLIRKNDDKIYAFKRGSPLVLGIVDADSKNNASGSSGMNIIASDIYAFSDKTNKAIFFNEDEFAVITASDYEFFKYDSGLKQIKKEIQTFEWPESKEGKMDYEHYMLKEIHEEPEAVNRLIRSLEYEQKQKMSELRSMIEKSKRVVFVAAGTSYHASLLGVYFLNKVDIEAHTIIASEFRNFTLLDEDTLVIAITQSGETMDVIEALHGIKQHGVKIASFVNVPYSTVQRMSNISVNICAGQEICVAATKTFVNQVLTLLYLASMFGYKAGMSQIQEEIENLIKQEDDIKKIAKTLKDEKDIYIIGRGFSYPIAREIALKLKEISYIHAEGMMAGELKHGTLALIEKGTPVIVLMPEGDSHITSNAKEVEARGARIIAISNCHNEDYETIRIPQQIDAKGVMRHDEASFSILAAIAGQILTYYIAKEKNLPIDKPRNLAKSVVVK